MFNMFAISGILIAIACTLMAIIMLVRATSRLHAIWGIFCIAVMLWGIGAYQIGVASDPLKALFWWKLAYVGVIFIPIMFTHFVHIFLMKKNGVFILFLYFLGCVYLVANLFTDYFINATHLMFNQIYFLTPTPLYNSYFALFIMLVVYSHVVLWKKYKLASGLRRQQIQYFFVGSALGFFGGSFSFLPSYNINIYPFMNLTVAFYPLIMGFAILRYRLMNINVIITQLLVASLWVFISARILISEFGSSEQLINVVLLLITVVIGVALNNSVIKEIKSREKIEELAKALGASNEKLKQLDKSKSEFISIASHQLKTPLSVIKGYVSLIKEGFYNPISAKAMEIINKIYSNNERIINLVNELLDLSRIEAGKMQFNFQPLFLGNLVQELIEDFALALKAKNLKLKFIQENNLLPIRADAEKLKEVISNLIDNAIKYSDKGEINVSLKQEGYDIVFAIQDQGRGMTENELASLFEKFRRGQRKITNTEGLGLGLYISKLIVEAHGGEIRAESLGLDKGSSFFVHLPLRGA